MRMPHFLIAMLLLMVANTSRADDTSSNTQGPHPGAAMQSLIKALSGRWAVTGSFEPGSETPKGGAIFGEQTWRAGPGGFTFMQEEDLHTPMGEMLGTGFMWWDQSRGFAGLRCLNFDPKGCDVAGSSRISFKWDGKELVIDFASSKDATKIAWHEVFSDITPGGFTQTGYSGHATGDLTKALTIHATRIRQ
jgi:hypothetical protein